MVWFDAICAVAAICLALSDFNKATIHADRGNMAGMLWRGLLGFIFFAIAALNAGQVSQYMGWI